jgi:hypothetical protein
VSVPCRHRSTLALSTPVVLVPVVLFAVVLFAVVCSFVSSAQAQQGAQTGPSALLLLAESDGQKSSTNFGRSAAESELERVFKSAFEASGMEFLPNSPLTPMVGERLPGLALGDEAAIHLGQQAGANLVVNVGVVGRSEARIRATPLMGQVADLRLRVLDVGSREVVYDKQIRQAGYGDEMRAAQKLAATRALRKAVLGLPAVLAVRFPRTSSDSGQAQASMSIQIRGAPTWREISSIFTRLATTSGVDAVHTIEVRQDQIHLRVASQLSVAALVSSLRRARIPNGSLSVTSSGNSISIQLSVTRTGQPIFNG